MQAPSLFGDAPQPAPLRDDVALPMAAPGEAHSLIDLLYEGFYMIFLLRNGHAPTGADAFRERAREFLSGFERGGKRLPTSAEDLYEAKFAFCALVDEVVLLSRPELRGSWGRRPLQLECFGEQLAGERFFDVLEKLRITGAPKLQVLEVYQMCLLLGFQGKYILEGSEKLAYLSSRLGEEIAHLKGRSAPFAPHWAPPDRIAHTIRRELPVWAMASGFALVGISAYLGILGVLQRQTADELGGYTQLVQLAPPAAHVTITLP